MKITSYEDAVYRSLLQHGRQDAKLLAKTTSVPPTAIYPAADGLKEKGFIQVIQAETKEFEALPPKSAVAAYEYKLKEQLQQQSRQFIEKYGAVEKKKFNVTRSVVDFSRGREISRQYYYSLFESVNESVSILGWRLSSKRARHKMIHAMRGAIKRNVSIRLILTGTLEKNWDIVRQVRDAGVQVKYYPLDFFSIVVGDDTFCKITLKSTKLDDKYNLTILDPHLTMAMQDYFERLWKESVEISSYVL